MSYIYPYNQSRLLISQEISGLQNCLQLEKLYLYDNQICEIKNLELQTSLEVLWLNDNCITQIQVRLYQFYESIYLSIYELLLIWLTKNTFSQTFLTCKCDCTCFVEVACSGVITCLCVCF